MVARSVSLNRASMSSASDARLRRVHAEEPAVVVEVLPDRQRAVEGVRLRYHADERLGLGGVLPHVDPADEGSTRGRHDPGGEHAGGSGLAGAVRSEQAEDLAAVHGQVELIDGLDVARVDLREVDRADDLVGGSIGCARLTWWLYRSCGLRSCSLWSGGAGEVVLDPSQRVEQGLGFAFRQQAPQLAIDVGSHLGQLRVTPSPLRR